MEEKRTGRLQRERKTCSDKIHSIKRGEEYECERDGLRAMGIVSERERRKREKSAGNEERDTHNCAESCGRREAVLERI